MRSSYVIVLASLALVVLGGVSIAIGVSALTKLRGQLDSPFWLIVGLAAIAFLCGGVFFRYALTLHRLWPGQRRKDATTSARREAMHAVANQQTKRLPGLRLCLMALVGLVLAAPAAAAPTRLHTGSTRYVRLVHLRDRGLSIGLTAQGRKKFRRVLRGYVLDATCTTLGKSIQGTTQSTQSGGAESTFGPGGRLTYHVLLDRHADFCDIGRARQTITRRSERTTGVPGPPLDSIALTQKGAAYLDEDQVTQKIFATLDVAQAFAHRDPAGRFPPAQKIAARFRGKVIALGSPEDSPPAGGIGFYSDGANHAEAVALSALNQRLFIDSNAGVLSTNAAEHLLRLASGKAATRFEPNLAATGRVIPLQSTSSRHTGIKGVVTTYPTCGVPFSTPGHPCIDARVARDPVRVLRASDHKLLAHTQTDRRGRFRFNLAPGTYIVDAHTNFPGRLVARRVSVRRGHFANVHLSYDNGIR